MRTVGMLRVMCVLICFSTIFQNVMFISLHVTPTVHTYVPIFRHTGNEIIPYDLVSSYSTSTEDIKTIILQHQQNTTISFPIVFDYRINVLHNPANSLGNGETYSTSINFIFIVKSSAVHFEIRKSIRNTWGYYTKTYFVVGKSTNRNITRQLEREIYQHSDLLQIDLIDSYFGNIYKTLNAIRWVVDSCLSTEYVVFVDDDFFVNPRGVENVIKRHSHIKRLYLGYEGL